MNSHPLALPGPAGPVFALDETWMLRGLEASRTSPRRRIMLPVHRRPEGVQRMVNFIQPGSYIRPHCHPMPEQVECVTVIRGSLGLLHFSPDGGILGSWRLVAGQAANCLADLDAGVWHTMVSLSPDSVMLEVKRGPYNPLTDKKFPGWAPEENSVAAGEYLRKLESIFER